MFGATVCGNNTVVFLYLEASYIWTVTLFKSDLRFQIRFWINFILAAAGLKSWPKFQIQVLDYLIFGARQRRERYAHPTDTRKGNFGPIATYVIFVLLFEIKILDLGSAAELQKATFSIKIFKKNWFFGRILDLGSPAELQKAVFQLKSFKQIDLACGMFWNI